MIRIIFIIMCTPKCIGSHRTKKVARDNITLDTIYLVIFIGLPDITWIPHIKTNNSGIVLRKNSV
ncbi:hypothetical protein [Clostridium beijerinckii]|uniref:hypothetical protein n=1 Tax=Clostridium beijerinckii TaxID=1520 RepID=UPI001A9A780D|nr:hypothetical protein [Clostridium beijerinckii]